MSIPEELIRSGNIHKQVKEYTLNLLKEEKEIKLFDLANNIEDKIKELTEYDSDNPLKAGIAFPTGLSINHCAAHWTPNSNDTHQILKDDDLIKIDYGVHINGYITDGAFSYSRTDRYDPLIEASKEATQVAIDMSGVDTFLGDIGENVQETIESYEIELNNKTYSLKSIGHLSGHQIGQYKIHCGKPVPNIKFPLMSKNKKYYRMLEGEQYAIETFPSTGTGNVKEDPNECSHYMINYSDPKFSFGKEGYPLKLADRFGTLAFCKRWMNDDVLLDKKKFRNLVKKGQYNAYPGLYDVKGSYVAQTEKSVYITEKGVVVLN